MVDAIERCRDWIGREERTQDDMSVWTTNAVAAMLDRNKTFVAGDALPPLWHWFYFLGTAAQSQLGADGHPQRGGFMPPVPLPRRMFAGARLRFVRPLTLGHSARRDAQIRDVTIKRGRSGTLVFVTVAQRFFQDDVLCIEEEQDIVYREPGAAVAAPTAVPLPAPAHGTWHRDIRPDPRLLFRFSALTFNAHRIHYDRPYAVNEEGYPGLIVHGPLTAILLCHLAVDGTQRPLTTFRFRGRAPLFDLSDFRLLGKPKGNEVELEARGPDNQVALSATAEFLASR